VTVRIYIVRGGICVCLYTYILYLRTHSLTLSLSHTRTHAGIQPTTLYPLRKCVQNENDSKLKSLDSSTRQIFSAHDSASVLLQCVAVCCSMFHFDAALHTSSSPKVSGFVIVTSSVRTTVSLFFCIYIYIYIYIYIHI